MGSEKKVKKKTEKQLVEERREEVLAQGRKFKYPLQYAKHKVMIVTVILSVLLVGVLMGAGWFALYKMQSTGDIIYRVTQVLPVRVAVADEADVLYSDYLMIYRSSLQTVEQQRGRLGDDEDALALKQQYKRGAMNDAEAYTYALKIAEEEGIEVTDEEIDEEFLAHQNVGGTERSKESFLKILQDNFGLSEREYRRMLYLSLIKLKVEIAIDMRAQAVVASVQQELNANGGDLLAAANALGESVKYEETGGLVDSMNVDGGRATMAMTLEPGQVSERFVSANGDGYYYVKLIAKTDTQVNYTSLKIPFTEFDKKIEQLRQEGKIEELIELVNL